MDKWVSKFKKVVLIVATCLIAQSCSIESDLEITTYAKESSRLDGSIIYWSLTSSSITEPQGLFLIAQGSGCSPALNSANVQQLIDKTSSLGILTIDKYGVSPSDAPNNPMVDCSETYFENHTVSQRVNDAITVLRDLQNDGLWNGELALFGGSEGGAVVSVLSHMVPETDAVVVFSTGTGIPLSDMILSIMPPTAVAEAKQEFTRIRNNPNSNTLWNGNTYKWWADIMDRTLSDDLLKGGAPVLLIHGTLDKGTPVNAARATQDAFEQANNDRLTYWELEDRGHQMKDSTGISYMSEVLDDVTLWLSEQLK